MGGRGARARCIGGGVNNRAGGGDGGVGGGRVVTEGGGVGGREGETGRRQHGGCGRAIRQRSRRRAIRLWPCRRAIRQRPRRRAIRLRPRITAKAPSALPVGIAGAFAPRPCHGWQRPSACGGGGGGLRGRARQFCWIRRMHWRRQEWTRHVFLQRGWFVNRFGRDRCWIDRLLLDLLGIARRLLLRAAETERDRRDG